MTCPRCHGSDFYKSTRQKLKGIGWGLRARTQFVWACRTCGEEIVGLDARPHLETSQQALTALEKRKTLFKRQGQIAIVLGVGVAMWGFAIADLLVGGFGILAMLTGILQIAKPPRMYR